MKIKKFYLVVFLVEASSVEQLVARLEKGKFRTCEEIKAQSWSFPSVYDESYLLFLQVAKSAIVDDDIVVGKQKMTLKCPVRSSRSTITRRDVS